VHKPMTNPRGLHVVAHDLRSAWEPPRWPVVFHHGIGTSHRIWDKWIPEISALHTVWRFDTRGFGSSPCPGPDHSWSLEEMLEDLFSVIEQSGAEKVHLVGESLGGTIVLAAGLRRPDRIASIQMSNASYKGAGLGELGHWQRQFTDEGVIGWSRRMMENRFYPGVDNPAALAWFADEQARTQPHVALGLGELLAGMNLGPELPGLTVPLSVVLPGAKFAN
jgi:3-oxoadipate enol-lactonase